MRFASKPWMGISSAGLARTRSRRSRTRRAISEGRQDAEASNWSDDVRSDSQKLVKLWTYAEAVKAVPYVRVILRELRETDIRMWHLHRVTKKDHGKHHAELDDLKAKGVAALEEL